MTLEKSNVFHSCRILPLEFTFKPSSCKWNFLSAFLSGYRYYLNKRRCETGGMRAIASWLDPAPTYPHVNVLAVDSSCSTVFYHSKVVGKWSSYEKGTAREIDCSQS